MYEKWTKLKNQKEWKAEIIKTIESNERALKRAIMIVFDNQTVEERMYGKSNKENGKGFNRVDAEIMSKIALKIQRGQELNFNDIIIARRKMPKYWKQIMVRAKANIEKHYKVKKEKQLAEEEQIRMQIEIENCNENSIACNYGICDECPYCNT